MTPINTLSFLFMSLLAFGGFAAQSSPGHAGGQERGRGQGRQMPGVDGQLKHIGHGHGQGYGRGSGQGSGQGQGCEMPGVEDHIKVLSEKLNLDQDQQARFRVMLEGQLAQMEAIRKDESLSREEKAGKVRRLREESASKVRDLLNDDQKQSFDEMQHDDRERMKQRKERGQDCSTIWTVQQ